VSGSKLDPERIQLTFGPSERAIGQRFYQDPLVNEDEVSVGEYSFLEWLQRFPHWHLTVRLTADTPPPPGVAIKKAAATAEKEDPEQAIEDAYQSGELAKPENLPAPWGPMGTDAYKRDETIKSIGDNPLPPKYGEASAPGSNAVTPPKAGWAPAEVPHVPNVLDTGH